MRMHRTVIAAALLALLAVTAVLVAGVAVPGGSTPASASGVQILTVSGNGQTKIFTLADLQAMPAYEGYACIKDSGGQIEPLGNVKGVELKVLLAEVGGMSGGFALDAVSSLDGFRQTYSYDQVVNGTETVFDKTTKEPAPPAASVSLVLIYEVNGTALPVDTGPVRVAVCQPSDVGQAGEGHRFLSAVGTLTLRSTQTSWKVNMKGLLRKGVRQTYTFGSDDGKFDSCASAGCHGERWTDSKGRAWEGVPLFLLVGQVDGGKGHGGYGAYDEALVLLKGYWIKLTSTTGKSVLLDARTIRNREFIMLADRVDGAPLGTADFPVKLVGPRIGTSKFLGRIAKIQLLPK
jgi:DMSO/TMAO reductase YedYZ molybdopterin-dependent catalytic subunit